MSMSMYGMEYGTSPLLDKLVIVDCAWWCCEGGEGDCVRELCRRCVSQFCCEFYIPSTPVNSLVPPAAQPKAASNHIVYHSFRISLQAAAEPKRGRCRRLGNELIKAPRSESSLHLGTSACSTHMPRWPSLPRRPPRACRAPIANLFLTPDARRAVTPTIPHCVLGRSSDVATTSTIRSSPHHYLGCPCPCGPGDTPRPFVTPHLPPLCSVPSRARTTDGMPTAPSLV